MTFRLTLIVGLGYLIALEPLNCCRKWGLNLLISHQKEIIRGSTCYSVISYLISLAIGPNPWHLEFLDIIQLGIKRPLSCACKSCTFIMRLHPHAPSSHPP
jgi:hypothetical protein